MENTTAFAGTVIGTVFGSLYVPPFGLGFLLLAAFVTVFHESDRVPILPVIGSYAVGFLWVKGTTTVWTFVITEYLKCLLFLIVYIVLGMVWTIPKLIMYVRKPKVSDELRNDITRAKAASANEIDKMKIASDFLSKHKWNIYLWMTYWPVNIVLTLTRDPIHIIFEWSYEQLLKTYQNIVLRAIDTILQQQLKQQ